MRTPPLVGTLCMAGQLPGGRFHGATEKCIKLYTVHEEYINRLDWHAFGI